MALFRVDYSGRGELADRQQKLAQMLSRLQKIAEGSYFHLLLMWECFHKNCQLKKTVYSSFFYSLLCSILYSATI